MRTLGLGVTHDYKRYRTISSYGKVVMIDDEDTNAYRDDCNLSAKWMDTELWKNMLETYKNIDDDWY